MRVLFLDMDGVLNSAEFLARVRDTRTPSDRCSDEWWAHMVDPDAVARLNEILDATGAKVVISSSWRYHVTPTQMQRVLASKGFRGTVVGRTPLHGEMPREFRDLALRGLEIEVWIVKNRHLKIESFVILDDMGPSAFAHMSSYLVETSWGRGLLDEHVPRATEMLTRDADAPSPPRRHP